MIAQICITSKVKDSRLSAKEQHIRNIGLNKKIEVVGLIDVYTIKKSLTQPQIKEVAEVLHNPVSQIATLSQSSPKDASFTWAIEIGFLPGVTDNVATTIKNIIEDSTKTSFQTDEGVWTSHILFVNGKLNAKEVQMIAESFANPLIQRISIKDASAFKKDKGMDVIVPEVKLHTTARVQEVSLNVSDEELITIGKQGIANPDGTRRGPLALDLHYMKAIQAYFRELGRNPTDIEIESIAQTWSEHCKHTIFADPIDEIKDGLFKTYIRGATTKIRKQKGKKDICASVFTDNSGALFFNDEYLITDKVETHNSPSALDPFGGAVTGIVGVNRDALGFGLGAKPILNRYGFCFAPPTDNTELYRDAKKTQPMLSAKRIMDGVISGVNSGGNCSGIPTPQGFVYFDKRFRGKPLVFVGTIGLIPQKNKGQKLYEKKAEPGDYIVVAGGRVGLDGIHGATFSSESLNSGSPATAVQIGDPITQKKLSDAIVKEARDLNLYTSITDNGAGGLSCAVAEMAKESGGFEVDLEKVPLKYPGLEQWQTWISESQERMTFSVPPKKWPAFEKLLKKRGVETTVIGTFTKSGQCIVKHTGKKIMDMSMEFLHSGLPARQLETSFTPPKLENPKLPKKIDLNNFALQILARPSIASTAFISQQYDHEVQATSVLKPLQGRGRVNADTTVIRPFPDSKKGVAVTQALYPSLAELDPAAMSAASIDTAVRNLIAVGVKLENVALLDNFCWCSANEPERLGQLKRAVESCYEYAVAYQTPFISGKDSMFNDFNGFDENGKKIKISVPPTLLISSLAVVDDVTKVVSLDAKSVGDVVYVLGETNDEMAGSEFFRMLAEEQQSEHVGVTIPKVDAQKNIALYEKFTQCVEAEIIASAQSVNRGGLFAALAKTSLGGKLGMELSLKNLAGKWRDSLTALFSESQGRIVVTVPERHQKEFEKIMKGAAVSVLGKVTNEPQFVIRDKQNTMSLSLSEMQEKYEGTFAENAKLKKKEITSRKKIISKPKTLVLTGYGINCEEETAYAFEKAGAKATIVHINDLIEQPSLLKQVEMLAVPGGFSFGDDTGSGNAFAQKLKHALWKEFVQFVEEDHLVIGVCNGCQILVNLGLFPTVENDYGKREVALLHNDSNLYSDRWVDVCVENDTPWLKNMTHFSLPIAHGEGKFFAEPLILEQLESQDQVAVRYIRGEVCQQFDLPTNPNGSAHKIAAITDPSGRVLGIMPHPERAIHFTQLPHWTFLKEQYAKEGKAVPAVGPGLQVFQNAVRYFTGEEK
jgi:phosphoribosylformylglycinamidine synthase subunit PurSL